MSKRTSLLLTAGALLALALGVRAGGGLLWNKLLAMHGVAPAADQKVVARSWPQTRAGAMARAWLDAFNSGEVQMRRFLGSNMAERSLKERSIDTRMETFRDLRKRYGTLSVKGITRSDAVQLDALISCGDGTVRTFRFELEDEPPHKLQAIRIFESHRRGH